MKKFLPDPNLRIDKGSEGREEGKENVSVPIKKDFFSFASHHFIRRMMTIVYFVFVFVHCTYLHIHQIHHQTLTSPVWGFCCVALVRFFFMLFYFILFYKYM